MLTQIFIGSYTTPQYAMIRRVEIDTAAGTIHELDPVENVGNPIYFAMDKAHSRLYVAQTTEAGANRATAGALAVYAITSAGLRRIDIKQFPFSVPCHISLDGTGRNLLFAEYTGAHAGAIALNSDGTFGATAIVHHEGSGPNAKRQESAHCHCAIATPDNRTLFICDLGTDIVNAYDLSRFTASRELLPLPESDFHAAPGFGPRHMIFSPDGKHAYIIYELGNAVQAFDYHGAALVPIQHPISTLPIGFDGETKCAAIRISPCGKWLLASNRGHDSIAAFPIKSDGTLDDTPTISPLGGHFPRDFIFAAPDCIIAGLKLSDTVALFKFNSDTGEIAKFGETLSMPRPLAFIQL